MRASIAARQQMQDAIRDEIGRRIVDHQSAIARLKTWTKVHAAAVAAGAPKVSAPLVMLALGDSWFDYPLHGNVLTPLRPTDIIAQLTSMGTLPPHILNISHFGDATTTEMALPKQQRMIDVLNNPNNWMDSGKPDAILFSGGGDDIAGDQFCIFLDYVDAPGATGLNKERFDGVLGVVRAAYLDLFEFRDRHAPNVPIYGHCYDFPIPNGVHPGCAGPWLKPSLDFCGWTVEQGTKIVRLALEQFRAMLQKLAGVPQYDFHLIDTQGTLNPGDWANELHPYPDGFKKLARLFVKALHDKFGDRI
jgi:hypothetical protein